MLFYTRLWVHVSILSLHSLLYVKPLAIYSDTFTLALDFTRAHVHSALLHASVLPLSSSLSVKQSGCFPGCYQHIQAGIMIVCPTPLHASSCGPHPSLPFPSPGLSHRCTSQDSIDTSKLAIESTDGPFLLSSSTLPIPDPLPSSLTPFSARANSRTPAGRQAAAKGGAGGGGGGVSGRARGGASQLASQLSAEEQQQLRDAVPATDLLGSQASP